MLGSSRLSPGTEALALHLMRVGIFLNIRVVGSLATVSAYLPTVGALERERVIDGDTASATDRVVERAFIAALTRAHLPWFDEHFYECAYRAGAACDRQCMEP